VRRAVVTLATLLLLGSCGGRELAGPLVGTWTYSATSASSTVPSIAVTFNADGTAEEVLSIVDPCSGRPTLSGYSWTATSTELTIAGSPTCSGTLGCPADSKVLRLPISNECSFPVYQLLLANRGLDPNSSPADGVTQVAGACQYTLSSDGKTLTLDHCTQTITLPPYPAYHPDALPADQLASYTLTRSR